jgi:hypothetical protein
MLENTEGAIKNGQSRETGNIWVRKKHKPKTNKTKNNNTISVGHPLCK